MSSPHFHLPNVTSFYSQSTINNQKWPNFEIQSRVSNLDTKVQLIDITIQKEIEKTNSRKRPREAEKHNSDEDASVLLSADSMFQNSVVCFHHTSTDARITLSRRIEKEYIREPGYVLCVESLDNPKKFCEIDVPTYIHQNQLQSVINGAKRVLNLSHNFESSEASIISLRKLLSDPSNPLYKDYLVGYKILNNGIILQPRVLNQWHPGACGYHSLINASHLLYALLSQVGNLIF
eukprot:c18278_g1_i2.p1 GENE.c18278_g1_i2~~c18278_g1_i2.p1  ORF type:complete len:235 (-),score=74.10 c18278_g1_i2:39-743(-)